MWRGEGREESQGRAPKPFQGLGRQFCGTAQAVQDEKLSLSPLTSQKHRRWSLAGCNSVLIQRRETEAGELLEDQTPAVWYAEKK